MNRDELAEKILLELIKKEMPRTADLLLAYYYPRGPLSQSPQAALATLAYSFADALIMVSKEPNRFEEIAP